MQMKIGQFGLQCYSTIEWSSRNRQLSIKDNDVKLVESLLGILSKTDVEDVPQSEPPW